MRANVRAHFFILRAAFIHAPRASSGRSGVGSRRAGRHDSAPMTRAPRNRSVASRRLELATMDADSYERILRARADRRRCSMADAARALTAPTSRPVVVVIDTFGAAVDGREGRFASTAAASARAAAREGGRRSLEEYDDARAPRDFWMLKNVKGGARVRGSRMRGRGGAEAAAEAATEARADAPGGRLRADACATCGVGETPQWRIMPARFCLSSALEGGSVVCNKCYAKARRAWTAERRARGLDDDDDDDDDARL